MLLKIKVKEIFHDDKIYKDPEEIRRIIESHLKHLGNIKVSIIKDK